MPAFSLIIESYPMLKYYNHDVVFQEYPDEVTLAINLTLCPNRCEGCHSAFLRKDIGEELTPERITALIDRYGDTLTCVGIQGGDNDPEAVLSLCRYVRAHYGGRIRTGWYSGRTWQPAPGVLAASLDYLKLGPYIPRLGPLSSPTTNQRIYRVNPADGNLTDITVRMRPHRDF